MTKPKKLATTPETGLIGTADEPNTKYLYVNPIIGRVMNGFAVTETDTFNPFEDGTRTYPDGSKVYFNGSSFTECEKGVSYSGETVGVTMQNGTKNYSIADINTGDTNSFEMGTVDANGSITATSYADGSTIKLSSAQALYIMSLITECGLGQSTNGQYAQGTYLTPYDEWMSTHHGDYDEIGAASSDDYNNHAINDTHDGTPANTIPHIIKAYTPEMTSGSDTLYPAFNAKGNATQYYNLVLAQSSNPFYLPDSYRGLGALMFGGSYSDNLDSYKENVVFLYSLNGAGNIISLNMNLPVYASDNYPILKKHQSEFKTGFGLINCLQSNYNNIAPPTKPCRQYLLKIKFLCVFLLTIR